MVGEVDATKEEGSLVVISGGVLWTGPSLRAHLVLMLMLMLMLVGDMSVCRLSAEDNVALFTCCCCCWC